MNPKKRTVKDIVIDYLAIKMAMNIYDITSHDIEEELVKWAKNIYGIKHNPATYSRAWRTLKQDGGSVPKINLKQIVPVQNKSEGKWRLITT